jgi:hypothetical protein
MAMKFWRIVAVFSIALAGGILTGRAPVSAVILGFGNPEFADIFPWLDCVNVSAPDGGPFRFDFILDHSNLAFDPENCEP